MVASVGKIVLNRQSPIMAMVGAGTGAGGSVINLLI